MFWPCQASLPLADARKTVYACWLLCGALCAASCADSPSAPTKDALEVRSAVPARDTVLAVGADVTFTYQVTFALSSARALVGMVLIPVVDGGSMFAESSPVSSIQRGTTTVTLTETLTIPARCTRLDVFIAMQNEDVIGQTSTVISYPVQ